MSDNPTQISRRTALIGALGATTALAVSGPFSSRPALAKAPMMGATSLTHRRFALGGFEVTVIHDGFIELGGPHPIFG